MPDSSSTQAEHAPDKGVNNSAILRILGGFLVLALLLALSWFWYAGHHGLSATPQQGPSGVGGVTAGDKGGKKQ